MDLLLIMLLILSIVLLSGSKIMFNSKYLQIIMFFFIMYGPFSELIEAYKLGDRDVFIIIILIVVLLLIFIWGYRKNKYIYSVQNVKQKDVIDIIEKYLEKRNIKYEVRDDEIQLTDLYKTIYVKGKIEVGLDCREIKDMDIYSDILMEVKVGIKNINKRYFPTGGIIYLILFGIVCWFKIN